MHTTIDGIARAPRISLFVWDGLPSCLWILFIIPITLIGDYTTHYNNNNENLYKLRRLSCLLQIFKESHILETNNNIQI